MPPKGRLRARADMRVEMPNGSDGPEWRTWEFESTGPGSYVERLYRVHSGGRQLLTVFPFARSGG